MKVAARLPLGDRFVCRTCKSEFQRRIFPSTRKLPRYCSNRCRGIGHTEEARVISTHLLRDLYLIAELGCPEIARAVRRDPKGVFNWLRRAGIPTRRRGSDTTPHFKRGERSRFAGRKHTAEAREHFRQLRLADGHVPYLKNGVHWLKGAARGAHPLWKGGITPERQAFYASEEWRQAVRRVWRRADAHCERCGLDHRTIRERELRNRFHVHHIVSFAVRELRAVDSNLVLLCRPCHLWVHSRANAERTFLADAQAVEADA